jgi:kinesin family protein 6/9
VQVIVALKAFQTNKKGHVPYRNSVMTTILKDSLGGNCKTTLITCLSIDAENFDESISTCRFSQRCGQLENVVKKNEVIDLPSQVKRLKAENLQLQK